MAKQDINPELVICCLRFNSTTLKSLQVHFLYFTLLHTEKVAETVECGRKSPLGTPRGGDPARITSHISLAVILLSSQWNWRKCPFTFMTQTWTNQVEPQSLEKTGYNELELFKRLN